MIELMHFHASWDGPPSGHLIPCKIESLHPPSEEQFLAALDRNVFILGRVAHNYGVRFGSFQLLASFFCVFLARHHPTGSRFIPKTHGSFVLLRYFRSRLYDARCLVRIGING
jgi:hypothetical protein